MADQVEEVKQKTDIVSLISEHVELKKAGRNFRALCPFHSEKTPSFMVSPELQIYKCFGCSEAGDAIAFLQKYEGMDFVEALKFLADRAGVKLTRLRPGLASEKEKLFRINTLAASFYQYLLLNHSVGRAALAYLTEGRGVGLPTIKKFQIGFSPPRPDALKSFLVDKKKIRAQDIERAGIAYLREGRLIDRLAGRLIFPLHDHRGNIAGFAGRVLPGRKADVAKYINTPETPIYRKGGLLFGLNLVKSEIKDAEEAVVVEGELDMISSWQAGVKNVVAIKGSALTKDQARLMSRFSKKLVLALDSDFAGDAAARRGINVGAELGLEIKVAKLGKYKDPDEMARHAPKKYLRAIEKAQGVWDFIIASVFSTHNVETSEGKIKISREIVPVLSSISDKIAQAHYIQVVAEKLGVPTRAVAEEVAKTKTQRGTQKREIEAIVRPKSKARRELLEERFLALAFHFRPEILREKSVAALLTSPLAKRLLRQYLKFSEENSEFSPSEFAQRLPKELIAGFAEIVLKDMQGLEEETVAKELSLCLQELKRLSLKGRLMRLAVKIRDLDEKGKGVKLKAAQERFARLSQKLSSLEEEDVGLVALS